MVERYYSPLRRIYYIITTELPDISKDIALQIAFKAINNSAGPNGLSWAPFSITPVSYTLYNWGKIRLNILPIYIVNSVLAALVYKGLINSEGFKF